MKLSKILILAAASMIAFTSCGSAHKVVSDTTTLSTSANTDNSSERIKKIADSYGSWTTVQGNANVEIQMGSHFSSNVQVKMERDKSISFSVRPVLGIEVARLVVSNDSVLVIDKLHKRYIAENVSLITNGLPVGVSTLQDIFLGRAFVIGEGTLTRNLTGKVEASLDGETFTVTPKNQYKGFTYTFSYDNQNSVVSLNVTPSGSNSSTYSVNYGNVSKTTAGNVAGTVNVNTQIKNKAFLFNVGYGSLKWNESINIDTRIPNGYSRMDAKSLMSMFGSE